MSIIPNSSCPDWCDPRAHIEHGPDSPEHRTAGLAWKPVAGETEITVRTIRLDSTEGDGLAYTGSLFVNLGIEDTASWGPNGATIFAATDLDPADARMLAAALVCEGERVEALQRRSAVTR